METAKHYRKKERGSAVLEIAVIIPICAIIISALLAMGPYIHMSFATRQAAYDCAVAAAQSLNSGQGYLQGMTAAKMSYRYFGLSSGNMRVSLYGTWARNGMVMCTVTYAIPTGAFPMRMIVPLPDKYSYTATLSAQRWKSEW